MIKPTFKIVVIVLIVLYIGYNIVCLGKEMFHNTYGINMNYGNAINSSVWWNPLNVPIPYGLERSEDVPGDLTLTNLYRKWHNIQSVNRIGVLEHSHLKQPGGDDGTNRQFYIAEGMDREAMRMQKLIRDEISYRRRPYTDAYSDSALGGNFYDCHIGDCQWDQDNDGKILGIPSVPGTHHAYY